MTDPLEPIELPEPEPEAPDDPAVNDPAVGDDEPVVGDRDEAMDALVAGARVDRGSVMDDGSEYTPLSNPDVGRIRKRVERFLEEQQALPAGRRVSRAKIAKAIGQSPTTLSLVLASKYPKGKEHGYRKRDEILRKLDRFVSLQEARRDAPRRTGFAWTRVAEEIRAVAQTCVLLETIGVIYGPAGIGKTMTLEALLDTFPGSLLVTIDDSTPTPTSFLRALSDKLKLGSARYRYSLRRSICDALRGSRRLLLIDEAHLAKLETLNTIRQLHDSCGIPVLLSGLPALTRMLLKGRGDDAMGATLYSRIGVSRDLQARCQANGDPGEPLYSTADIKRVFARSKLRIASDAMAWLEGLANEPEAGGLRAASNALRLAIHIGTTSAEPVHEVTLDMLLSASRLLKGAEAARAIANRIKQRQATRVA